MMEKFWLQPESNLGYRILYTSSGINVQIIYFQKNLLAQDILCVVRNVNFAFYL